MLSIVIPTYNRVNLLVQVIKCLESQSYKNFEVLIIDDHSTDDTEIKVKQIQVKKTCSIIYRKNIGKGQRDGKKLGLKIVNGEYICFLDDDIEIRDPKFLEIIMKEVNENTVIQPKIVMLDKNEKEIEQEYFLNSFSKKPFPILEIGNFKKNYGKGRKNMFPFIEFGVFFHKNLKDLFIDNNLIKDAYGESFASGIKILKQGYNITFLPITTIYHLGSDTGGSKRFNKKSLLTGFSEFHYGYFYNMIYLQSRYMPFYIWLWLPYYISKCLIAVLVNRDIIGFWRNGLVPILLSVQKFFFKKNFKD